jgi:Carboxypeptidase regulatory-like domain/Polysaccharide lyase family 4, domain II
MSKFLCAMAALILFSSFAFAQPTDARNCSVDGTVVNSVTGAPILRAHVSVIGLNDSVLADSDVSGKWSAQNTTCGTVTIAANRPGFLRFVKNTNLSLVANTPLHGVELKLAPQAVLTGHVLDDQGDPILGAQISLMTSRVINGVRGIQASTSANTNDLGEYRFSGLAAGKYILCANAGGGTVVANGTRPYSGKCYPGPVYSDAGATSTMDVAAGYEGRVDFTLTELTTVRVSGVLSGKQDPGYSGVNLVPRTQIARMAMGLASPVKPDGTFSIRGVPPGSYTLTARANDSDSMTARMPLEVGGADIEGIQLHLEPMFKVAGSVKILSTTGRNIEKPQYSILLRSPERVYGSGQTTWNDNRTAFTISEVEPGNYRLELSPPAPFYLKIATLSGRDMMRSEIAIGQGAGNIEIVISDDGGVVEGDVSGDDGVAAAWIFLERDGAPSRNVITDANGHFKIATVPPGDYKVYAWDDNNNVEYANPEWMQRNGKGVSVTVDSGQTAQVKLVRQNAPE